MIALVLRYSIAVVMSFLGLAEPLFAQTADLPQEVRAFISRRDNCDHFRGEASDDANRRAEIDRELRRLCSGSDAELARLMRRYAGNKVILDLLNQYDPDIEGEGSAE
ncbi:hypothetical protein [Allorhizobium taibaishanense]|uniref:Uncharacterized protein n=1 Tax=Allorhizobium taibaishanense TaxID=887144 RepID=A0A1Q9A9W0_9HYPH|nr:hypothetical protein [Allorhizobium taibaishanense]MBB4010055.1 hypothetical protein [Allorhizobium taibaishanense]OLP51663.1 hypothetical protein BJF91_16675 [Allorhizobium taibaishanense]